jgi:hypothetical protein
MVVPTATAQTVPVVPTVATVVALLLQVPPAAASVRLMHEPMHTLVGPVMGARLYMVTVVVL